MDQDLNARIAARRAEVARLAEQERLEARAREVAQRRAREAAVDQVASELSGDGLELKREGEQLALVQPPPLLPSEADALSREKVNELLKREARKLWTRGENWQVIGCIVGGLFTVQFAGLGVALIVGGLWRGAFLNDRYRGELRNRYPALFGGAGDPGLPTQRDAGRTTLAQKLWWRPLPDKED